MKRINNNIEEEHKVFTPVIRNWCYFVWIFCFTFYACKNDNKALKNEKQKTAHTINEKIQTVEVVKPLVRSFKGEVLITGTAMPNQTVMLHAMESGYLKNIRKDIGDLVRKGEIIAVLENPDIEQLLVDAKANFHIAQAESLTFQSELVGATADWKAKDALSKRLKEVYQKTPQLTPISEVEKAAGETQRMQAMIETIKAKSKAHEQKIQALQQRIEMAEKRVAMLQIKAPFNGVVTQRFVDQGAMIQSGIQHTNSKAIVEIQDIDPIRLTLPIPEADAGAIKKGMDVAITFPELLGQTFKAKVSRTSGVLDPNSKTMQVEIDIANPKASIITGMYAKALMQLDARENVLSLPFTAQTMYQDEVIVLVVKNNKVERMSLRKGLSGKDYFEVLNTEITPETQVIIKGKGLVKSGQIVKPTLKEE